MKLFQGSKTIKIIHRLSSRLSLAEWRSNPDLVTIAKRFLSDPNFQIIVDTLRNSSPHNWIQMRDTSIEERAIIQARTEGYALALNNLEALGTWEAPKEELEPTFEQPEEYGGLSDEQARQR